MKKIIVFNNDNKDWAEFKKETESEGTSVVLTSGASSEIVKFIAPYLSLVKEESEDDSSQSPDSDNYDGTLLVFDDCDVYLLNNATARETFTRLSSHKNMSIMASLHCATQSGSKNLRAIMMQCNFLFLYPNVFDSNCLSLSRALAPGRPKLLPGSLRLLPPFEPLVIALSPYWSPGQKYRFFSNILTENGENIRLFIDEEKPNGE